MTSSQIGNLQCLAKRRKDNSFPRSERCERVKNREKRNRSNLKKIELKETLVSREQSK